MKIYENDHEILVEVGRETIGYIARAKRDVDDKPSFNLQHSDCILPFGGLVGVVGLDGAASGGELGACLNPLGINKLGKTLTIADLFVALEKPYVPQALKDFARRQLDANYAKAQDYKSAVHLIQAPSKQITNRFIEAWQELVENPKVYNKVGANCAVRAHECFVKAGILSGKKFHLTPNQLFNILSKELSQKPGYNLTTFFGYVGFEKSLRKQVYDLVIKL